MISDNELLRRAWMYLVVRQESIGIRDLCEKIEARLAEPDKRPEFEIELPDGDDRAAKIWWVEQREGKWVVSISIDDPKPEREPPNEAIVRIFMGAAMLSGNEGAIRLAAQLAGAEPCTDCGYIWNHCRCPTKQK